MRFVNYLIENEDMLSLLIQQYHVEWHTISEIFSDLKKYQRETISLSTLRKKYVKYAGLRGLFVPNTSTYKLYRGLLLRDDKNYTNYYPLEDIKKTGYFIDKASLCGSWTKDLNQAILFAYGNRTWMSRRMNFSRVDKMSHTYGIVLEHVFPINEVLFDFEFMQNNINIDTDFSEEEIIVVPKKNAKYKVLQVLENYVSDKEYQW